MVAVALDDEDRGCDGVELGKAALLGAAGWVEREREAEHGERVGFRCGPACDLGAG
jgi:hypothetical protein